MILYYVLLLIYAMQFFFWMHTHLMIDEYMISNCKLNERDSRSNHDFICYYISFLLIALKLDFWWVSDCFSFWFNNKCLEKHSWNIIKQVVQIYEEARFILNLKYNVLIVTTICYKDFNGIKFGCLSKSSKKVLYTKKPLFWTERHISNVLIV